MADISAIKLPDGITYNLVDKTSGYTKNTGTVTSVAVSAGTGISVSGSPITSNGTITISNSGVTGVKGSAESSYRTGQVNLTPANLGAVALSGDTMTGNLVVPAERIANTYYGVSFGRTTATPVETILYTGIKWVSGSHMPVIHITGYAYGLQSPVEFKIGFYIYGGNIGWSGVTNMGSWAPDVYLFKYTQNSVDYVAVGFAGSCYFLQLSADVQDEMGKFNNIVTNSSAWSWSFLTTTGTIPTPDSGVTCIKVPYRANILNPDSAKSVPWSGVTGKPSATGSATTGITIAAHGTGTVIGVQSSTTTASKVTVGSSSTDYGVTAAGSASTWTFEEKTIPNVTAAGSGSASLTFTMDSTDTKKLKITFSHTHTAPTIGTAIKVQSKSGGGNGTAPTLGSKVPTVSASDVTVPIKNTSASTFVTGTTHTITDNGHTHTI